MKKIPNGKCLITGGSHGLGFQITKQLLKEVKNVEIIILDLIAFPEDNDRVIFYHCDLSCKKQVTQTVDKIIKVHGHIDVLINNAGMRCKYENLMEADISGIYKIFQVNVISSIRIIQKLCPPVNDSKRQFYVVNIASALGIISPAKIHTYASSKSALIAFHESWSFELESNGISNIRTLLVLPGQINTGMFGGFQPPNLFWAPLVESEHLAKKIVVSCIAGMRGEIYLPIYVNFMHLLKFAPYTLLCFVRKLSGMDDCLPLEK